MADYETIIEMIKGEGKTITWTFTLNGVPINLAGATFFLGCKQKVTDSAYLFTHEHADFDISEAAVGKVSLALTDIDTNISPIGTTGVYFIQLKTTFAGDGGIDKSDIYTLRLLGAVVST